MKQQNKKFVRNTFLDSIIKSRQGGVNVKCFSPQINKSIPNNPMINILINKINIKELSKFSDRPIDNSIKSKKVHLISDDKLNYFSPKARNKINVNRNINYRNTNNNINNFNYGKYNTTQNLKTKKNFVIFSECPKKLSDYILKNKNKKKVYQITYLEEKDIDNEKFPNNRMHQISYSNNMENIPRIRNFKRRIYNLNTYNNYNNYNNFINGEYGNYNDNQFDIVSIKDSPFLSNENRYKNYYTLNNIYSNNQNNDELNVIKIQSIWRGHIFRKYLLRKLYNFYNIMKLLNTLYSLFYNKSKPEFKLFLNSLYEDYIPKEKENNKKNLYIKVSTKNDKIYPRKNSFNINKENIKKKPIIDKNNINLFIPGNKNSNLSQKIYIKKNSIKKSATMSSENNIDNNNIKNMNDNIVNKYNTINNTDSKEDTKKSNKIKNKKSKDLKKLKLDDIVKYITKKTYSLHFPLLLYRLRILQKMNLIDLKYKYLSKLILIKEKITLRPYFLKYRNIVFSQTLNKLYSQKKNKIIKDNKVILNNNNKNNSIKVNINKDYITNNNNNINNNKDNINNNKSNKNNYNLNNNKNNENNNKENNKDIINRNDKIYNLMSPNTKSKIINNKKLALSKIINKKEKKISLIHKYFNDWKKIVKKNSINSRLKFNKFKSNKEEIIRFKTSSSSSKKHIKVKKLKSNNVNNFSHTKSNKSGKALINSFESDNIRKMKLNKINILPQFINTKKSLHEEFYKISPRYIENSFFIQKIANITNKVSNKNNVYKCFIYWKKKTKESK